MHARNDAVALLRTPSHDAENRMYRFEAFNVKLVLSGCWLKDKECFPVGCS